jgi:hypothetical protein
MPKYFIVTFFFFCSNLIAQTLKFDVVASYSIKNSKRSDVQTVFGISSNNNFAMRIFNEANGSQSAVVYNLSMLKQYSYKIKPIFTETGETVFNFESTGTRNFNNSHLLGTFKFEFKNLSSNDSLDDVKLKIISKKEFKDKITEFDIKYKKSEKNYFYLFRIACMHALEFLPNFDYEKPGIVTSCVSRKDSYEFNLITFEDANLSVTIPSN